MNSDSFVSVIVPTYFSEATVGECLRSLQQQTYTNKEIIVVDNFSTDSTKEIAQQYTHSIFTQGPERSAQRNFGSRQAIGEYVVFIDSDMVLSPTVLEEAVSLLENQSGILGVIIPEESFGNGFWAACKKLERSFYIGNDAIEAARFFRRKTFLEMGGYDENMISGEDWDFSGRVKEKGRIERISSFIYHNEGKISLGKTIKKKYYYAQKFTVYLKKQGLNSSKRSQTNVFQRYMIFLRHPKKLFANPGIGIGMLFMKTCEFFVGGLGYLIVKFKNSI